MQIKGWPISGFYDADDKKYKKCKSEWITSLTLNDTAILAETKIVKLSILTEGGPSLVDVVKH